MPANRAVTVFRAVLHAFPMASRPMRLVCGPRVSPIPFGLSLVRGDEKSPLFSYSSFILREWGRWGGERGGGAIIYDD